MQRAKHVALGVLAVLALVVLLQNTETVQTSFLFWNVALPRAALLLMTLVVGFLGGLFVGRKLTLGWRRSD